MIAVLAMLSLLPPIDPTLRTAAIVYACMPMLSIYPVLAQKYQHEGFCAAALLATFQFVYQVKRAQIDPLVMMLITIPKVFLFDMPGLQGLQRVLSFAGLGVSLMALAFVYQRFVFRRPAEGQSN